MIFILASHLGSNWYVTDPFSAFLKFYLWLNYFLWLQPGLCHQVSNVWPIFPGLCREGQPCFCMVLFGYLVLVGYLSITNFCLPMLNSISGCWFLVCHCNLQSSLACPFPSPLCVGTPCMWQRCMLCNRVYPFCFSYFLFMYLKAVKTQCSRPSVKRNNTISCITKCELEVNN